MSNDRDALRMRIADMTADPDAYTATESEAVHLELTRLERGDHEGTQTLRRG
jgi:hypothetical protein